MAIDDDRPEDEIENEFEDGDDSELFEPPSEDPLSDALAEAAAGDGGDSPHHQDEESGEDDSDLFEPPSYEAEEPVTEAPATSGHQPVLPTTDDETEHQDEEADLFGAPDDEADDAGDEEEDEEVPEGARQRYPWLQQSDEEEEELEEEHSLQGRTLIFVGAGVVFVIFSALIWFLYSAGDEAPGDEDVALIEAPEGPAKVEPEDRGGMEVPDQDKLVFDRVSGQETEMEENLLEGPEEAVMLPDQETDAVPDQLLDDREIIETPFAHRPAVEEAAPVESAPVEEPAPVETAPPPPPAAASGTHMVQLGSFGSMERAETAWRVMKNKHSITLAGLGNDVQRADLGARGVYYRLRTEALALGEAQDLCADLKADGQDCLVVRR